MIVNEVKSLCNKVNQGLLLNDLYETKMCNRLLEPESNEEIWGAQNRGCSEDESDSEDEQSHNEVTYLEANLNMRYKPGTFACPLMWSYDFPLHMRLREAAGATAASAGSRGLGVTRMVLNNFSVMNRKNMFVYRDDRKNIFYFKITEVITNKRDYESEVLSRTSSVSSQV